jgi:hypothetical protein
VRSRQQKKRAVGQEELVRSVLYLLPGEVPGAELHGGIRLGGVLQVQRANFDAVRGFLLFLKRFAAQRAQQRRFPHATLPDHEQLGSPLPAALLKLRPEIDQQRLHTLIHDLGRQRGESVAERLSLVRLASWPISGGSAVSSLPVRSRVCARRRAASSIFFNTYCWLMCLLRAGTARRLQGVQIGVRWATVGL